MTNDNSEKKLNAFSDQQLREERNVTSDILQRWPECYRDNVASVHVIDAPHLFHRKRTIFVTTQEVFSGG